MQDDQILGTVCENGWNLIASMALNHAIVILSSYSLISKGFCEKF